MSESLPGSRPGPELVAAQEHQAGPMPATDRVLDEPVAESDLSVSPISTCLASLVDAGLGEPRVEGGPRHDVDDLEEAARPTVRATPFGLDCLEQLVDPCLGRVGPLGHGDEVDLPAVQALGDDGCREPAFGEPRDRERRPPDRARRPPRALLPGGRRSVGSRLVDGEDLGAPVQAEVELAGPPRAGQQLAVHVPDMGAADDHDVDAAGAQLLDELADLARRRRRGRGPPCRPSRRRRLRIGGRAAVPGLSRVPGAGAEGAKRLP